LKENFQTLAGQNKYKPKTPRRQQKTGRLAFAGESFTIYHLPAMKILIVKLSSIGDVVHTLPTLAAIRRALPAAEISWAVEKSSAEILRGNHALDRLIELDTRSLRGGRVIEKILFDASAQLNALRRHSFDVALDFQGLFKSAMIAKLAKAKRRFGFSKANLREPASRFLLTETVDVPPQTHIIRKNLTLAEKALGIEVPAENFEFPIATLDEHRAEAAAVVAQTGENFAILNPAGGWATKLWPAANFGALADRLWEEYGLVSAIATAPNERELAAEVARNSRSGRVVRAETTLKGFYELARRARVYVGGDTGPTHLAVAAGAPLVGIFGPTEWWRNGSPNADDICVERNDIGCRVDCHRRRCANWICLEIPVETVFQAVRKRLKLTAR
jgi:heptosyltransferase I